MKGSLITLSFFALGCLLGSVVGARPLGEALDLSFVALCALMACVGFGLGNDPDTLKKFRHLDFRMALLPLVTIAGTLCGAASAMILLPHLRLFDILAVGSGFGYYSLSSIFITEYRGAALGTTALLANVLREIFTLLLAPLMARYFGRLAPISAGGATSMDTTLPVITQTAGSEYVPVSVYHGVLVDFSVPFLVSFFCML